MTVRKCCTIASYIIIQVLVTAGTTAEINLKVDRSKLYYVDDDVNIDCEFQSIPHPRQLSLIAKKSVASNQLEIGCEYQPESGLWRDVSRGTLRHLFNVTGCSRLLPSTNEEESTRQIHISGRIDRSLFNSSILCVAEYFSKSIGISASHSAADSLFSSLRFPPGVIKMSIIFSDGVPRLGGYTWAKCTSAGSRPESRYIYEVKTNSSVIRLQPSSDQSVNVTIDERFIAGFTLKCMDSVHKDLPDNTVHESGKYIPDFVRVNDPRLRSLTALNSTTLECSVRHYSNDGHQVAYSWIRNGVKQEEQTKKSYLLVSHSTTVSEIVVCKAILFRISESITWNVTWSGRRPLTGQSTVKLSSEREIDLKLIVIIVVGGVAVMLLIASLITWQFRKRNRQKAEINHRHRELPIPDRLDDFKRRIRFADDNHSGVYETISDSHSIPDITAPTADEALLTDSQNNFGKDYEPASPSAEKGSRYMQLFLATQCTIEDVQGSNEDDYLAPTPTSQTE